MNLDIIILSQKENKKRRERIKSQNLGGRFVDDIRGKDLTEEDMRENMTTEAYKRYLQYGDERVRGSLGKNSLALSLTWKMIMENISQPTLVLEDDSAVCSNFYKKLDIAYSFVPKYKNEKMNWDLLYISWNKFDWHVGPKINECVTAVQKTLHGSGGLLVHPKCKDIFLSMFPSDYIIDHDIPYKLINTKKIKAYMLTYYGKRLAITDNFAGSTLSEEGSINWDTFDNWDRRQ
jgi:GR25 family glycosyltransferase involved in LPS biosynthesis